MRCRSVRAFSILLVATLLLAAGAAWALDPPVRNWTVPKSWAVGKTASADAPPFPTVFRPVDPCRVIDTRTGSGFSGEWGPPSIVAYGTRSFTIAGQCGIPVGVSAVSFNFAVWAPTSRGDLRVWPAGAALPTVSTLNWESGILALANAAVIPLGTGGAVSVRNDSSTPIDIFVDVNGYYIGGGNDLTAGERLWISGSANGYGIIKGTNTNTLGGYGGFFEHFGSSGIGVRGRALSATGVTYGVAGQSDSSDASAAGVYGSGGAGRGVHGTSSSNYGVYGNSSSSYGVYGTSTSGTGVYGYSATGADGVFGKSGDSNAAGVHGQLTAGVASSKAVWGEHQATGSSGIGVYGSHAGSGFGVMGIANGTTGSGAIGVYGSAASSTDGTRGVYGYAGAASGATNGVLGFSNSSDNNAVGVKGIGSGGAYSVSFVTHSGVYGVATSGYGVLGASKYIGVKGILVDSSGGQSTVGYLGYDGTNGVWAVGNVGATGAKTFVEPHPTDPTLVIRYAALEGPEVGTYFRASGTTTGGFARIPVPDSFRTVTESEGLSVQVTPVGGLVQMAVVQYDLNEIVVQASRDTKFFVHVNGVRRGYAEFQPVTHGTEYMPEERGQKMPAALSTEIKKRLVENGTYHADGTVNMETAHRVGWAKAWDDRKAAAEAAARQREAVSKAGQQPQQ